LFRLDRAASEKAGAKVALFNPINKAFDKKIAKVLL
jgi:hypothetical protein